MTNGYPAREKFFAHRYVRVLHKSCAAQDIGPAACYLCCIIAHTEDAARYAGPARFWNSQLSETMGFRSPQQLVRERQRAVDAGWLVYERDGTRAVGKYFVKIPERFSKLSDAPIEAPETAPTHSDIHSKTGTNQGGEQNGFVPKMERECDGSVTDSGTHSIPIPCPFPNTNTSPDCNSRDEERASPEKKPKAKPKCSTPEDRALAQWMWETIRADQPDHKPPDLDAWSNEIRLARERDHRTHDALRDLFARVRRDDFWRPNIRSPAKLREKFDQLTDRLKGKPAFSTRVHEPGRYDNDKFD